MTWQPREETVQGLSPVLLKRHMQENPHRKALLANLKAHVTLTGKHSSESKGKCICQNICITSGVLSAVKCLFLLLQISFKPPQLHLLQPLKRENSSFICISFAISTFCFIHTFTTAEMIFDLRS